jgi:hypothetical protein
MKEYKKIAHISIPSENISEFSDLVGKRMDEYQSLGLQVEVQYQQSMGQYSAMILGYSVIEVEEDK